MEGRGRCDTGTARLWLQPWAPRALTSSWVGSSPSSSLQLCLVLPLSPVSVRLGRGDTRVLQKVWEAMAMSLGGTR